MNSLELENKVFNLLQQNIAYTSKDVALLAKITIPKASLICHRLVAKDKLYFVKRLDSEFQPLYIRVVSH